MYGRVGNMLLRSLSIFSPFITALLVLVAAGTGIEMWLRCCPIPIVPVVAAQTSAEIQAWLVPSSERHHELRRKSQTRSRKAGNGDHPATRGGFRTNSFGLRGDEPVVPRPDGIYRILLLGDDSVCGAPVPEEHTISSQLQNFLNRNPDSPVEVINGGVPGYCPLLSWLQFEQELYRLEPHLVILHFDMTDVADDMVCRRCLIRPNTRNAQLPPADTRPPGPGSSGASCPHPSLQTRTSPRDQGAGFMTVMKQSATATWFLAQLRQAAARQSRSNTGLPPEESLLAWISDHPPDLRIQVRQTLEPMTALRNSVQRTGAKLLVVTCPSALQVTSAAEVPRLAAWCRIQGVTPCSSQLPFQVLREFCQQENIAFCDTTPAFRQLKDGVRLFSKSLPVLSRSGMALYAREVAAFLLQSPPSGWKTANSD